MNDEDKWQPAPEGIEAQPKPRRVGPTVTLVITACMLIVTALAGGVAYYVWNGLRPVSPSGDNVRLTIPPGLGITQIAGLLEKQGIIRNHTLFVYYLRFKDQGSRFQAGEYDLRPGMVIDDIIAMLNNGNTVREEMFRFTIPEGFTVKQIADRLGEQGIVKADEFLKLTEANRELPDRFTGDIPANADIRHRLEGYLFPETYEMKKTSSAQEILDRLVSEWDRKLELLPPGWMDQMNKRNLTFHQVLTIASLVEREVVLDEERPIVAGVIYNRLDKKMPLQIDATVQYALEKPKDRLLEKDLQVNSPYNTYLHSGLPPGPIASPSLASLQAALYPQQTNYLFYVTKKDGSQGHLFAETFEQHNKNIAASKKK